MQTPAILNISSPSASPAPSGKGAAAGNGTFNQMLSQQVAERREAAKPAPARAPEKPAKSEPKQAEAKQPTPAKPQDSKEAAAKVESKESSATEKDEAKQAADAATATPTATELLAQLAGMTAQTQSTAGPSVKSDDAAALDTAAVKAKQDLVSTAEPSLQKELAPTDDKSNEFDAALRDAGKNQAADKHADMQAEDTSTNAQAGVAKVAADKRSELPPAAKMPEAPVVNAAAQIQASMVDAVHGVEGKAADRLTPHVGTPAWDQALGQKVVWMVAGAQQSASLTLNPPDLGPLQVVLNVNNGQADASFYAAQPEVRQALESALPKLRDMLDQAGVALGQASVSAGMPERHNEASSQSAQQAGRNGGGGSDKEDKPVQVSQPVRSIGGQGLVDAYA